MLRVRLRLRLHTVRPRQRRRKDDGPHAGTQVGAERPAGILPASIARMAHSLTSTDAIQEAFRERGYIADRSIATAVFLGLQGFLFFRLLPRV